MPGPARSHEEPQELRRCLRDLEALSGLPALWVGEAVQQIGQSLADVLTRLLGLAFVDIELMPLEPGEHVRVIWSELGQETGDRAQAIRAAVERWAEAAEPNIPPPIHHPLVGGAVRVAVVPIGASGEHGTLSVASRKPDFPTELDRMLLGVAANQVAIALQNKWAEAAHARLAAIVESSDDAILGKTLEGIITSWNHGAERMFGYPADEVIGSSVTMLMPPEAVHEEAQILERIRRGERIQHFETVRRRKDGTDIVVSLTISPVRDARGVIVGASKIARDITSRKQTIEALRSSEATLHSFYDSTGLLMGVLAQGGEAETLELVSSNRAAEQFFDAVRAADPASWKSPEGLPPALAASWRQCCGQAREAAGPVRFEHEVLTAAGPRWLSTTLAPIPSDTSGHTRLSFVAEDITQRKEAEEAARQADRRKDEFLAMLAHELRNPIAAISSAALVSRYLNSQEELVWSRDVILRQVKHLTRMIDDLLDVSRLTRGKIRLRKERVHLPPVIGQAVEAVRPLIDERHHELTVTIAPGSLWLESDPTRLEQIIVNLLTNAAKYTEEGGQICLSVQPRGKEIDIQVRDNGEGIPAEMLASIFEPFTQVDWSMERARGGLGMGLTLVRTLVELHGGTVTAASEGPGRGSTFTVRLPALDRPPPVVHRVGPRPQTVPGQRQITRILVVDDNFDTARSMAQLLASTGHLVQTAGDGPSALALAGSFRPQVVLLDIVMPGMDGYEVAEQLRRLDTTRRATLIAVSGLMQEHDHTRVRAAGFDHYLAKPVDFDALTNLLPGETRVLAVHS